MLAIGCDQAGYALKGAVIRYLEEHQIPYTDYGCYSAEAVDYPVYAKKVCRAILAGEADRGILICGTGIGMSMAANKFRGIRAAVAGDCFSAEATRLHNDANVLCMGARVISEEEALQFLDIFLDTPFSEGENHIRRIGKLERSQSEQ